MELLQKRFVSDMVIGYFQLQADILRRYTDKPITTNGLFADVDYAELTERHLDFITFDNYPNFGANGRWHAKEGLRDREVSYNLMKTRAISPIFGIMEQQTGPGGWTFNLGPHDPYPRACGRALRRDGGGFHLPRRGGGDPNRESFRAEHQRRRVQ